MGPGREQLSNLKHGRRNFVSRTLSLQEVPANFVRRIKMVSKDQEPFDLSQKENIDMFFKSMGSWQDNMSKDEGQYCYGYVDIEGFKPNVYGETYTSTV